MKNKLIALALMAGLSIVLLSGCITTTKKKNDVDNSQNAVLRFAALDLPEMKYEIEEFKKGFKNQHPNVDIVYEPVVGDYTQKLILQATSKTLPDVFWMADSFIGALGDKNVMLDLNPMMDKYKIDKTDLYESMLELGQHKGHQYMIPRDYSKVVTYYNKKMFDEKGIKYPTDDWTWDEFVQTASKFVKGSKGDYSKFGCDAGINWVATAVPIIEGLGGSILNDDGTGGNINTPETISIFNELKKLVDSGILVNNFTPGYLDFNSGNVAMYFSVRPMSKSINDTMPGNWDVVSFPKLPKKAITGAGTSGYAVSANSENKDLASQLVFYIISDDGQKTFMKTGNAVPIRKSLSNTNDWRDVYKGVNNDAFVKFPERDFLAIAGVLKDTTLRTKIDEIWTKSIENVVLNIKSAEQSLADAQADFDKLFKK